MKKITSLDDLEIGSEIRYINLYGFEIIAVKISHSLIIDTSNVIIDYRLYQKDNNKLYFGNGYNIDHMVDTVYDPQGNIIYNHNDVKEPARDNDWFDKAPF